MSGMAVAFRVITLLLLIILGLWALNSIAWVVGLMVISLLIVYVLYPVVQFLRERWKLPYGVSVGTAFLVFMLFCVLVISLIIPIIHNELIEIVDNFPFYANRLQESIEWVSEQILHFDIAEEFKGYILSLSQSIYQALEYITEATVTLLLGVVDLFFIFFLVFYLLYDFQSVRLQVVELFPIGKRPLARELVTLVDNSVGNFMRGSLIRCTIVGLVTGMTLLIIGMPYAFLLGLLAGIFNFVLYIGPYIAAIPALLLSLSPLTPAPLLVIAVYVVIQVLDGLLLAPLVLGRVVNLKPITIIIAILAGGKLAGLLGMVIAVPVASICKGVIEIVKRGPAYKGSSGCG